MNYLSFLGVSILTFLSQVTISGANVALESSDVESISTSLGQGFSGLLSNVLSLFNVLCVIFFVWIVINEVIRFFKNRRFEGKIIKGKRTKYVYKDFYY